MSEQDSYGGWFGGKAKAPEISKKDFEGASGAEQDRYGGWFGGKAKAPEISAKDFEGASGAEQDRYGGWFGGKAKAPEISAKDFQGVSGAEQDRYGGWFGGKAKAPEISKKDFEGVSGAEQDRYGGWFGGKAKAPEISAKDFEGASGAEQDRYGGWFGGKAKAPEISSKDFQGTSGAEQDRYEGWFGGKAKAPDISAKDFQGVSGAEQDRYGGWFGGKAKPPPIHRSDFTGSGAEQDRYESHFGRNATNPVLASTAGTLGATSVGILRSTLLPSFALHSGISVIAYAAGRLTNRVEAKDWLWPSAPVANAWWSAIGSRMLYNNLTFGQAVSQLSYDEKLLLSGVTVWGARLFYRIVSRSLARGGDDVRYEQDKKDPGFWNNALATLFLPEAVFQTLISLPFILPFRAGLENVSITSTSAPSSMLHHLAVFIFGAGFALETLADIQLSAHKQKSKDLNREGVWSIVRHPNYLGDALTHLSFPLLLYSTGFFHPLALLGPITNYVFLRYVGGDAQTEASQLQRYQKQNPTKYRQLQNYRASKNSFWPNIQEFSNPWLLSVIGAGVGTVLLERGVRALFE